jgi:hypothetical protein
MEDLTELMRRLLEIQSGGRQRNADRVAEDQRPRVSVALELPDGRRPSRGRQCGQFVEEVFDRGALRSK